MNFENIWARHAVPLQKRIRDIHYFHLKSARRQRCNVFEASAYPLVRDTCFIL